jgi:predicted Zn finger-like uncharacterized protein
MLLTCPACGAQYAPPEGAIPDQGRIVRCSACRAEWRASPERAAAAGAGPAPASPPQPQAATPAPAMARAASPGPANMAASLEAEPIEPQRGGFLAGFLTVAVIAGAVLALYFNQQAVAQAVPALAEPLAALAAAIDSLRALLTGLTGSG